VGYPQLLAAKASGVTGDIKVLVVQGISTNLEQRYFWQGITSSNWYQKFALMTICGLKITHFYSLGARWLTRTSIQPDN
jgi:hypothetical protein